MPRSAHRDMQAADGPPCTVTISGYFLPASKSLGSITHPCTRIVPLFQCTLRISPHAGLTSALRLVSCFQLPMGPAQASGGVLADCRTIAVINLSPVNERPGTQASPEGVAVSSPVQSVLGAWS